MWKASHKSWGIYRCDTTQTLLYRCTKNGWKGRSPIQAPAMWAGCIVKQTAEQACTNKWDFSTFLLLITCPNVHIIYSNAWSLVQERPEESACPKLIYPARIIKRVIFSHAQGTQGTSNFPSLHGNHSKIITTCSLFNEVPRQPPSAPNLRAGLRGLLDFWKNVQSIIREHSDIDVFCTWGLLAVSDFWFWL